MAKKRTPEEQREYMRQYRARKTDEALKANAATDLEIAEEDLLLPLEIVPDQVSTDRERGLPRSNYYSDHKAPGGWTEVIQKIDPKLATKILDKIAPTRKTFR